MPTIIVDDAVRDQLLAATEAVEIRDRQGRLLGQLPVEFLPPDEAEFPSDEELERSMREGRGFTPEEVVDRLRSIREQYP